MNLEDDVVTDKTDVVVGDKRSSLKRARQKVTAVNNSE